MRCTLVSFLIVLVLGLSATGAMPFSAMNNGKASFSGQIVSVALNPQPEPPAPYEIGLNAQFWPTLPCCFSKDRFNGMSNSIFSGQIQTVTINPQPEPPGTWRIIAANQNL
jgi:hypothetical protein